jgi:hypothetical protein
VAADNEVLEDLLAAREEEQRDHEVWARSITHEVDIGIIFRKRLAISPEGISWKGQTFPLETITRIRWGAVITGTNGIPSGTNYAIAFGDVAREAVVQPRRGAAFNEFIDRPWRAVGVRLLMDLLKTLRSGATVPFGPISVSDTGITLQRRRFLAANVVAFRTWDRINTWTDNGMLSFAARDDPKATGDLSFKDAPVPDRLLPHLKRWRRLTTVGPCEYEGTTTLRMKTGWATARRCAGLDDAVTPHVLKHSCITWLLQAGISTWEVAGFTGASEKIIRDVYGHHSPNHLPAARMGFRGRNMGASS